MLLSAVGLCRRANVNMILNSHRSDASGLVLLCGSSLYKYVINLRIFRLILSVRVIELIDKKKIQKA